VSTRGPVPLVGGRRTTSGWGWLPALVIIGLGVAAWQLYATRSGVSAQILPSPARVAHAGWLDRGALWTNTLATLQETLFGFLLAAAVGFVLSMIIDASGILRNALMPLLIGSQTLPLVAIAPLVIIWFGFGLTPKILLVALLSFFPITVAFLEGYQATDPDVERLLISMGAGRLRVFRSARLPTSMPFFFAGLRIAFTYSVVVAIFAEYAGATAGLGVYIEEETHVFRTDLVFAAVLVTTLVTVGLFAATYALERIMIPWYRISRQTTRR
jgi:ABC-type nitrate/sulfonate/bicarbonate transport system permease component